MSAPADAAWWPQARLAEGLAALAQASGLAVAAGGWGASGGPASAAGPDAASTAPVPPADPAALPAWLDWAAARAGLEIEPVQFPLDQTALRLCDAGPALLPWGDAAGGSGFLLLLRGRGRRACLLGPDGRRLRLGAAALAEALNAGTTAALAAEIAPVLACAGIAPARQPRVRRALVQARLAGQRGTPWWLLRLPPTAPLAAQFRHAGLARRLAGFVLTCLLVGALEIAAWAAVGEGLLDGRLEPGWLLAGALLLATALPLQWHGAALNAALARGTALLLKARLLVGALRLDTDRVRHRGAGQWLGQVIESQALESLAVGGGLLTLVGLVELLFAATVLALGAAPAAHLLLLAVWLAVTLGLATAWGVRLRNWTAARLALTHRLVEQMTGHRTRLAQGQAPRHADADDAALAAYLGPSRRMDAAALPLHALGPGAWLLAALVLLGPALAAGSASPAALAVSVGGMLLAQRAWASLAGGFGSLARAGVAWQQVAELLHAGRAQAHDAPPVPPQAVRQAAAGAAVVDARGLGYGHAGAAPLLHGLDLQLQPGDQCLLQGPSGGGKSTLAALLVGLRRPQSGLLLLAGLDAPTLGTHWQALAAAAPQFHENHVLSGTLAFNLLMGRQWPPSPALLQEAQALCEQLGLGELLARMPAGLQQRVGETGWQLSHGERSRVFLARALLQRAPLTVLDESFAALDPLTLAQCLQCARRETQTLLVIAHP